MISMQRIRALKGMLPVGVGLFVYTLYVYVRTGCQPKQRWYNAMILVIIGVLLVFGVARNML